MIAHTKNDHTTQSSENIRWLLLLCGTICLLFSGIIYAWSILKVPFAREFGWSAGDLATNYTITISLFCIGCIIGGFMMRKFSAKVPVILGGILVFLGFFLTSRLDGSSVVSLFLSYGVLAGLGIGISYNTILAAIGAWFPDRKGFASGCLMMGFGASTLILGNLASSLIENPSFGWRKVFLFLAVCTSILLIGLGVLIRLPGPTDKLPQPHTQSAVQKEPFEVVNMTSSEMIRRVSFWKFFLAMVLLGAGGSSVISFAKDFSISVGSSAAAAGLFVGVLSIFNGFGRMIAGSVFDHFGRKTCVIYVGIVAVLANAFCLAAALTSSIPLCFLGFCLIGLSYGGNTNVVSVFITAFYGTKYYAQNLSLGLLTLLPSSFLAKFSTSLLTKTGSYIVPFAVLTGYAAAAMLLNLSNKKP